MYIFTLKQKYFNSDILISFSNYLFLGICHSIILKLQSFALFIYGEIFE